MKKTTKALLIAGITTGAVMGGAGAAFADGYQAIDALYSPGGYGVLSTQLDWHNSTYFSMPSGSLKDLANDGHGPYLHVVAISGTYIEGEFGACNIHNTSGSGSSVSVAGKCAGIEGNGPLDRIHVWVCNGGDANGDGAAEGGCHGREYWNQVRYPGKGSSDLGNHYGIF